MHLLQHLLWHLLQHLLQQLLLSLDSKDSHNGSCYTSVYHLSSAVGPAAVKYNVQRRQWHS